MTSTDYAWWSAWRPEWAEAHCVTLASDITPGDFVRSLGSAPVAEVHGVDALFASADEHWAHGYDPSRALIGVAGIGDGWTLVAEMNGYLGVTQCVMGPISIGRTVVSHFRNINAVHRFYWWRDGCLLVDFDALFPDERWGAEPDALLDDIRGVGIPLEGDSGDITDIDLGAAGFALAQRITDVACIPELFERSDFLVAIVETPGAEEQLRYDAALRTTWRTPPTW